MVGDTSDSPAFMSKQAPDTHLKYYQVREEANILRGGEKTDL